ncbi:hypothetical protein F4779DRAFT_304193 [Xylariaceae sp. FL0662B]|nr:hypothetical protein F4779DRAFT_304193 [Xylariaceae sp. FL0662B]
MDIPLQAPNPPLTMLPGHTSQHETTLNVRCHDHAFKKVTVSDDAGKALFHVEGTTFGTSWSWRRKVLDSTNDRHLFDFRHESIDIKNGWVVDGPDSRRLCSLVHKSQITKEHSAIDATVRTEAGEQVLVAMRPIDREALTTTLSVGDTTFGSIQKVEANYIVFQGNRDKTVWKVRVAPGVDLSLIMAMVLCRAEMGHVWKQ